MKILFASTDLRYGGAQKIMCFLAYNLAKKHTIYLIVFAKQELNNFVPSNNVEVIYLNKNSTFAGSFRYYLYIRKLKPDIVFSSISNLNILNAILSFVVSKKIRFIVREASVITEIHKHRSYKFNFLKILIKVTYPYLNKIVAQSSDMLHDLNKNFKIPLKKIVLIPNPITIECKISDRNDYRKQQLRLITVARLSEEKGIERIIHCLSLIKRDFKYTLIGDGPLKNTILEIVKFKNLSDRFELIEKSDDIPKFLLNSDLYIQGSYVEGFPNSILDANYCGLPVFAFNCLGGTKEIITNNINGIIVMDELQMIDEIINFRFKNWDSLSIRNHIISKFNTEQILNTYNNLFINGE